MTESTKGIVFNFLIAGQGSGRFTRDSEKADLSGWIGTEKRASVRQSTRLVCRRVVDVVSARRRVSRILFA
jgi:hypothetical protein